jgi:hypothetical protein
LIGFANFSQKLQTFFVLCAVALSLPFALCAGRAFGGRALWV